MSNVVGVHKCLITVVDDNDFQKKRKIKNEKKILLINICNKMEKIFKS